MEEQWTNILRKGRMTQALRTQAIKALDKFNSWLQKQEDKTQTKLSNATSDMKRQYYEKLLEMSEPSKTFYRWLQTNLEEYDRGEIEGGFKEYWKRYMQLVSRVKTEADLARGR